MNILVTGAAGYIGSIVTEQLVSQGHRVIALDNLQQGHRQAVADEAIFVQADLGDLEALEALCSRYAVEAVMHLAAETVIEHSMTDPARFFRTNVLYGVSLLDTMLRHNVNRFVFSSTAAVYGEPETLPIAEDHPLRPVNAYGESKLMFERVLQWYGQAYGLRSISLRYFNASGASQRYGYDRRPATHLVPIVLNVASGRGDAVSVYGTDYDTRDGTCIRDYIHVLDIAAAHLLALEHLERPGNRAYNLGNGQGYSVLEVIEAARRVTGVDIAFRSCPRRAGDPAALVASSARARSELGWQPKYPDLESMIESAWRWQGNHPQGYRG
jgi:UDP-glucose 4-epimerase